MDTGPTIEMSHGDCRDLLPTMCPNPAAIISDPPYGIAYKSGWGASGMEAGRTYATANGSIAGDADGAWAYDWIRDTYPGVPVAVFAGLRNGPPWPNPRAHLVWDKGDAVGMGDLSVPWRPNHEPIYVYGEGWSGRRTTSVLRGAVPSAIGGGRLHPHEKPVSVLLELVGKAPPGVILDPFAGTGATLVAADMLGRSAVGVESEEVYYRTARARLQPALFPGDPALLDRATRHPCW